MTIPAGAGQPGGRPAPRSAARRRWDSVTFVHFQLEPADLLEMLPAGVRADTFDGAAWAGLALFEVRQAGGGARGRRLRLPARYAVAEVRVPVLGPDGERAALVLAADVGSPVAALAGRVEHGLPAHWSAMSIERDVAERVVTYSCRRRVPGPREAACRCSVRVGGRVEPTMLDRFLLDRAVRLGRGRRGRVRRLPPVHGEVLLHDAVIDSLDDRLLAAAGLPEPQGRMVVRYAPGLDLPDRARHSPSPS